MPLSTTIIKTRLATASWIQKDNEAQNIINGATREDLRNLDAEGVLRLYEALALLGPRIYSINDAMAMKKLTTNTQFQPVKETPRFGVNLVKSKVLTCSNVQSQLTPDLVTRIYAAERKRLSWYERLGVDGDTVGRGQLGQPAYTDVKNNRHSHLGIALQEYLTRVRLAKLLNNAPAYARDFDMSTYRVKIPTSYNEVWQEPLVEDFVVAAYLTIRIIAATKNGRSPKDTAYFAVALYHGMRSMIVAAQEATKDEINWAPVETELLRQGHNDEVNYVHEVVI